MNGGFSRCLGVIVEYSLRLPSSDRLCFFFLFLVNFVNIATMSFWTKFDDPLNEDYVSPLIRLYFTRDEFMNA